MLAGSTAVKTFMNMDKKPIIMFQFCRKKKLLCNGEQKLSWRKGKTIQLYTHFVGNMWLCTCVFVYLYIILYLLL